MYQALYRKWRPKTFDDVVGQKHITETLKNQVAKDRLSHAYLFIGTRGTGKTSCAKILSKAVNCLDPQNGNPCNRCSACLGIDDGSIMDVVEMDAASNNGVDNVRALRDEAIFSPAVVKKRVYIIDEVHMLSGSAFNALLKILEEPPSHLMFILATTELHKVPATILSRCQRHSFKRLDIDSISGRLDYVAAQEGIDLTPEASRLIARLAEGGMRDALSMLDQCSGREQINVETIYSALGLAGRQSTAKLLHMILSGNAPEALDLFQQLWQEGKDPATLLGELGSLQRDILIRHVAPKGGGELLTGGYDDETISGFAGEVSEQRLIGNIKTIQRALSDIRNGQTKTICELCIIEMSRPELGADTAALLERIERLESASASAARSSPEPVRTAQRRSPPPQPVTDRPPFKAPSPMRNDDRPPFDIPVRDDDRPPFDVPPPAVKEQHAAPVSAPETTEAGTVSQAPVESSDSWDKLLKALRGVLPAGILAIISDPVQAVGELDGSELVIHAAPGFAMHNVDRPDVLDRIMKTASSLFGTQISAKVCELGDVKSARSERPKPVKKDDSGKLDELSKFDIVKFK